MGRRVSLAQGRALGGSSAINAQVFVPPSKTVIDAWESLGNPGWNWKTLEPYYSKIYSSEQPEADLSDHFDTEQMAEGKGGLIQISNMVEAENQIAKAWIETFETLGHSPKGRPFSGELSGAFIPLATIDPVSKERSYSASRYHTPIAGRNNLHVLTNSFVQKIVLEKDGPKIRATGVEFTSEGQTTTATARREVILAAGSFQSPKMLELSGIGGDDLLQSHGIKVKIDNPAVGSNLQDHLVCGFSVEVQDHVDTIDDLVRQDAKAIEAAMGEYMTNRSGPFASVGVVSYAYIPVVAFLSEDEQSKFKSLLNANTPEKDSAPATKAYYDIASSILLDKLDASGALVAVQCQGILPTDPARDDPPKEPISGKFVTLVAVMSQPLSRGSVHIQSSDASAKPAIDPKFLDHPLDLEVFARQMQSLEAIAEAEPFKSSILKEGGRRWDPRSDCKNLDNAKTLVKASSISMWHPTSTCSMLPQEMGGVVDDKLIVYGTSNLRVVDASVMPLIPRANTQSSVYAVAERGADIIKAANRISM